MKCFCKFENQASPIIVEATPDILPRDVYLLFLIGSHSRFLYSPFPYSHPIMPLCYLGWYSKIEFITERLGYNLV